MSNGEGRRNRKDVLIVAPHVKNQAHLALAGFKVAPYTLGENAVGQIAVRRHAVGFANLDAQRQAEAVHISDHILVATSKFPKPGEEISALLIDQFFVIFLFEHLKRLKRHSSAQSVRRKG